MSPRDRGDLMLRAPVFEVSADAVMATSDDSPMVIDIDPTVLPEDQWILEGASFVAMVKNAPSNNDWMFPVSGLWLVPFNTPVERTRDAGFNLNLLSRGQAIPLSPDTGFRTFGGGAGLAGAIGMIAQSGFQVSVPGSHTVRAILTIAPGSATPGPGEESYGRLTITARVMKNLELFQGDR